MSDDADESMLLAPPNRYTTEALFADAREILIEHAGKLYRLRITAKGGLILTK